MPGSRPSKSLGYRATYNPRVQIDRPICASALHSPPRRADRVVNSIDNLLMAEDPATALAELEREIDARTQIDELVALATAIDALGRTLALEITRLGGDRDARAPLELVLLRVPAVHTRALLRTAEKLDDAGSPRRAARVLLIALRKAIDANLVDVVATALEFTFAAFDQHAASEKLRAVLAIDPAMPRRERRHHHLALVDDLEAAIEWDALDDELAYD